jgi:hypothetical protein
VQSNSEYEASRTEVKHLLAAVTMPGQFAQISGNAPSAIVPSGPIATCLIIHSNFFISYFKKVLVRALDTDPLEFARQLTIFDEEAFAELRPWEFLNLAWTRPSKYSLVHSFATFSLSLMLFLFRDRDAPVVTRLLRRQQELRGHLQRSILVDDSKIRKKFLKFWVTVCIVLPLHFASMLPAVLINSYS